MDSRGDEESDYSEVVENLKCMFGSLLTEDVISAIVESCEGDLNLSVDAVMKITNDGNSIPLQPQLPCIPQADIIAPTLPHVPFQQPSMPVQQPNMPTQQPIMPVQQPTASYSLAAQSAQRQNQNTGTIPKQIEKPLHTHFWTPQIRNILKNHNQGNRIMIIMRGVPGSGKTHLAKQLVDMMIGATAQDHITHIFSTDDYFMYRGQYRYDKAQLSDAHAWNQKRVSDATQFGLSPIIVDNTNVERWELEPYMKFGVQNGYIIEIVEPTTPWARKANQLAKINTHNVPIYTIKRMLDSYHINVTVENMMHTMKLKYPHNMKPPVKRSAPPILEEQTSSTVERQQIVVSPANSNTKISTLSQSTSELNINSKEFNPAVVVSPANSDTKISMLSQSTSELNINSKEFHPAACSTKSLILNQERKLEVKSESPGQETKLEIKSESLNQESKLDEKSGSPDLKAESESKSDLPDPEARSRNIPEKDTEFELTAEELERQRIFLEEQKKLDEFIKVEDEWENGENWEDDDHSVSNGKDTNDSMASPAKLFEAKPQRKPNSASAAPADNESEEATKMMQSVSDCQDWSKISMFMPPWDDSTKESVSCENHDVPVEKVSNGTCMEIGDTNVNGKNKVISATPRDINELHLSLGREKIPEKRMLDKSTMTTEKTIKPYRCPNEEKHFRAFRKMFKNVDRAQLRDVFEQCCGNVNWAVEIVLDGMNNNELKTIAVEELSDAEEDDDSFGECNCMAKYDIVPDVATEEAAKAPASEEIPTTPVITTQTTKKRRDVTVSDETIQIKRQIEKNVVISDDHYSKHCLKIRKMRRGEIDINDSEEPRTSSATEGATYDESKIDAFECESPTPMDLSDDEEDMFESDRGELVNFHLGVEFIQSLDQVFQRQNLQYPEHIVPKVSLPMSLLEEINALWMESLTDQIDEHAAKQAVMVQQDEDFARQLMMKEQELSKAGKEPEVPDFKEIMDMDLALAMYQKEVDEWRNSLPNDLAAKMTRDKLYNLFPDIDKDTLLELLLAHDNSFNTTVEVLLASMGRHDILQQENGVNKFVAERELHLKTKVLEEQRKILSDSEWPLLSKDQHVDMETVESYRHEADQHLMRRNIHYQKAQDCIRRGMTQVANYYSELATFHKQKYEHASALAVASLMQYHGQSMPNCMTIDLHYLRVKEAKETLDLFIDTHISKLRESGKRRVMLFFITGRGRNSPGRARIKPATMMRLRERGLGFSFMNPGLLTATINANTKLTHQLPVP